MHDEIMVTYLSHICYHQIMQYDAMGEGISASSSVKQTKFAKGMNNFVRYHFAISLIYSGIIGYNANLVP